jgi:hypothetical protein
MHAVRDPELSVVRLSDFGLRREPPRPVDDRQPGYEALFDYDTLFYDVFRSADGKRIVCLGPPLLNCEPVLAGAIFRVDAIDRPLKANYIRPWSHLQPSCRLQLPVPETIAASNITIEGPGNAVTVPVQPSGCGRFRDRRVVMTMIKDTPLRWVRDWARYHVEYQGADSVIVYDNASSIYRTDDIREALGAIGGAHLVIRWAVPYGPNVGPRGVQDSFYCQPGALDHARRRYCASARGVLNCDVDEFLVGPPGQSVFEEAEQSNRPGLLIYGRWVETVQEIIQSDQTSDQICHADCIFAQRKQSIWRWLGLRNKLLRPKWVAIPARCDERIAWTVHDVLTAEESMRAARSRRFLYRHFRPITTQPRSRRRYIRRYMPIRHMLDRELISAFETVFGQRQGGLDSRVGKLGAWRRG